ncbi:hypothetical protein ScPMuIL_015708 [Solemya velum]
MSFKFNFGEVNCEQQKYAGSEADDSRNADVVLPCKEIRFANMKPIDVSQKTIAYEIGSELSLLVLDSEKVEQDVSEKSPASGVINAVQSHSDLVPSVYEGGLKVWECSLDLVQYLHTEKIDMRGKYVLELGCGAGLPGIFAAVSGAAQVYLQDYNEEVLEHYTLPNFCINTQDRTSRFFSGDWSSFEEQIVMEKIRFDVILTSETIYEPQNYDKLHSLMDASLRDDGIIYLAAKSYYFGVGGSVNQFAEYCSEAGCFVQKSSQDIDAGVPRKIIVLQRKTGSS